MTRVGAKRARGHYIILHAAVRARFAAAAVPDSPEVEAVAAALQCGSEGAEGAEGGVDASHAYGRAIAAALGFCVGQLGGVRLSGRGAVQMLSAAWEDARGVPAALPANSSQANREESMGEEEEALLLRRVSRTLRLVVTVSGLETAAAVRLLRAACVCVRSIAVPLEVVLADDDPPTTGKGGRRRGRARRTRTVRILHDAALRVVRA